MAFTPTIFDAHARILRINVTCDESDDSIRVDSVTFYRSGADYVAATNGYSVGFSGGAFVAAGTTEFAFDQVLPPPSHIAINPTFQA